MQHLDYRKKVDDMLHIQRMPKNIYFGSSFKFRQLYWKGRDIEENKLKTENEKVHTNQWQVRTPLTSHQQE
jgi:hypothetical protein